MTVPGKGGRPRKWLSDADRVRAYRARARGVAEPQQVELARHGEDAIAAAIERERRLESLLSESREEVKQFRRDLIAMEGSLDRLQERIDELERERVTLLSEVAELNDRTSAHRPERTVASQLSPSPNRAARRRASRRRV